MQSGMEHMLKCKLELPDEALESDLKDSLISIVYHMQPSSLNHTPQSRELPLKPFPGHGS